MIAARPGNHLITLGADKTYDVARLSPIWRDYKVTPHVARTPRTALLRSTGGRPATAPPPPLSPDRLLCQRAGA